MLFILKVQNTVDVVCSADPFTAGDQEPLFTFTIITTESSKGLSFLHDRMPVILTSTEDIESWLSASNWSRNLCKLICPNESEFDCYAVPKEVGKVGTNDPSFFLPVTQRRDGIEAFFQNQRVKSEVHGASTAQPPKGVTSGNNQGGMDLILGALSPESHAGKKRGQDGNIKYDDGSLKEDSEGKRGIQVDLNQGTGSSYGDIERLPRVGKRRKTDGAESSSGHSQKITSFFPKH